MGHSTPDDLLNERSGQRRWVDAAQGFGRTSPWARDARDGTGFVRPATLHNDGRRPPRGCIGLAVDVDPAPTPSGRAPGEQRARDA